MTNEHERYYSVWKTRDEHCDDDAMELHGTVILSRYDEPARPQDVEGYQDLMVDMHDRRCVVLPFGVPKDVSHRFASSLTDQPADNPSLESRVQWLMRELVKEINGR